MTLETIGFVLAGLGGVLVLAAVVVEALADRTDSASPATTTTDIDDATVLGSAQDQGESP